MNLSEYRSEFLEDVNARASAAANFTHSMFVEACAELLSDASLRDQMTQCTDSLALHGLIAGWHSARVA